MDYSDFRYKAVVDYIEIRVTLRELSHVSHMRRYTGLGWVGAVDGGDGGAATVFDLRIEDPQRYSDVHAVLQRLGGFKALACAPVVSRIEVSLDAYPHDLETPPEALAAFAVNLTGWHQYPAGDVRIYDRHFREMAFQRRSATKLVSIGCMLGLGHKNSAHFQRAYYKTTDKGGEVELAPKQRRVRFENNYSGQALPVTALADLSTFRFETLAKRGFSFRALLNDHGNKYLEQADKDYTGPVGKLAPRPSLAPRGRTVKRNSGRHTRAIAALNEEARQKLKNLSARWARHDATETPPKRQRDATESCNAEAPATDKTEKQLSTFSVGFLWKIRYLMRVWGRCPNNLLSILNYSFTNQVGRAAPSTIQSRFIPLEIRRILEGVREKFFSCLGFRTFKVERTGMSIKGSQQHFSSSNRLAGLQTFKSTLELFFGAAKLTALHRPKGPHTPSHASAGRFRIVTSSTFGKRLNMSSGSLKASTVG